MSKEPESWKEVTAEMLVKLPHAAIAAWAGRCAMRAQPLITPDSFGPTPLHEAASHIETLDIAATLALVTFPSDPYIAGTIIAAATNATEDTLENPAYAAASAANSAALTINSTNTVDAAKNAMSAYDYATNAIGQKASIKLPAAIVDYEYLIQSSNANDLKMFNTQPLWHSGETPSWLKIVDKWGDDLEFLDSRIPELHGIYNRHMKMIEGMGVDYNDARERIDRWLDRNDLVIGKVDPKEGHEQSSDSEKQDEQSDDPVEQSIELPAIDRGGPPTAIHDKETKEDLLGRESLVRSLAAMFAAPKQATPFTLALLGDWGAGKSSVMAQLQEKLESNKSNARKFDFLFAKFNAWEYEHTDDIRAGLAQEVVKGLSGDLSFYKKFDLKIQFAIKEHPWDFLKVLIGIVFAANVASFVLLLCLFKIIITILEWQYSLMFWEGDIVLTSLLGSLTSMGGFIYLWKKYKPIFDHPLTTELQTYLKLPDYGKLLGIVPVMKKHIKTICQLRGVTEKDPAKRLIVFIDDLDRCGHKCIMHTLDAVRLVMDIPNVIVVIAIDYRIAFAAVANRYADLADDIRSDGDIARDYLGKIIQLPVELPEPTSMCQFIRERLFSTADKEETERLSRDKNWQSLGEKLESYFPEDYEGKTESPEQTTAEAEENTIDASMSSYPADDKRDISEPDSDLIPELMPESPEDCRRFEFWTGNFEFNNPRQLIRLRNAYRLLTQLDSDRHEENTDNQRMAMLFWLEFLHQKSTTEQNQYEDLLIKPKKPHSPVVERSERERINKDIGLFGIHPIIGDGLDKNIKNRRLKYSSLKERVSRFVLPAIRTRTSKVIDSSLEGEDTSGADEIEE
ncbi:MAG: hypothetical protein IH984_06335 [Planctomycetes bacterium]|nr:hypothetical protein [Planctomycetota bacterium]